MNLIEVNNICLGYESNIVLKDLSFNIDEGDFVCIVGPNGSGKSTLIKGILGLIRPLKGKITFNNLKQNMIGYMPQETRVDQTFPASVMEIVMSGTLNSLKGIMYSNKEKEVANKTLKLLGIEELKDKSFSSLSGGQRQKVLLARSLCATEKLLILDEPSNNLDSKSKKDLYKIVKEINKKEGITVLMVTHDLDHNNLVGNKILSLREDEVFFGTTEDFVRSVHEC